MASTVETLRPGDHACLLFDSDEQRRAALSSFVRQGLKAGDRVLYVTHGLRVSSP